MQRLRLPTLGHASTPPGRWRFEHLRSEPDAGVRRALAVVLAAQGELDLLVALARNDPNVHVPGQYKPGTIGYDPEAHSVTVLLGRTACGKNCCFAAQARRIEKLHRVYNSLGPNSNTVARTLLAKCHARG
jgi:hypothetical protein